MDTFQLIIASEKRKEAWAHLTKRQGTSPVKALENGEESHVHELVESWWTWFYKSNPVPIKISISFVTEIEKTALKWIWNCKRLQIDKKNKSNAGRITIQSLKIQYRSIVIKTVWYRQKNRHVGATCRRRTSEPSLITSHRNELQMEGTHLWDQRHWDC